MMCDAVVMYSPLDREAAEKFVTDSVSWFRPTISRPVEIKLFDDGAFMDSTHAVNCGALCFVYLTRNFVNDESMMSVLDYTISGSVMAGNWNIVPLYTEPKNATFRVPWTIGPLKGLRYYDQDQWFRSGFATTMTEAVNKRNRERGWGMAAVNWIAAPVPAPTSRYADQLAAAAASSPPPQTTTNVRPLSNLRPILSLPSGIVEEGRKTKMSLLKILINREVTGKNRRSWLNFWLEI